MHERKKEKKERSYGVTVFAWLFIIKGLLVILFMFTRRNSYAIYKDIVPFWWTSYKFITFLLEVGGIIGGIGALRLILWARALLIWIALSQIIECILWIPFIALMAPMLLRITETAIRKRSPYHIILTPYFINKFISVSTLIMLAYIIFYSISIYFFTRPKVKEQFK